MCRDAVYIWVWDSSDRDMGNICRYGRLQMWLGCDQSKHILRWSGCLKICVDAYLDTMSLPARM